MKKYMIYFGDGQFLGRAKRGWYDIIDCTDEDEYQISFDEYEIEDYLIDTKPKSVELTDEFIDKFIEVFGVEEEE